MSDAAGHAAFHKHKNVTRHDGTKKGTRANRRLLLQESARHLNEKWVAKQAGLNASIVRDDTHLNQLFVNGRDGLREASSIRQVLDYGDAREKRVTRKIRPGSRTVDLFVVHLPKTLCKPVFDFYERYDKKGNLRLDGDGKPLTRVRWVARDIDEAKQYFEDAVAFIGEHVSPGGPESIHGYATNFDESTPHIQIMADPYASYDPENPRALRMEASRAYGSHRDVKNDRGQTMSGGAKVRGYQAAMRQHMIDLGWPVEQEVSERAGEELPLKIFKELEDRKAEVDARARSADLALDRVHREAAALEERRKVVEDAEAELPRLRQKAREDGKRDGEADALKVRLEARQKAREQEQALADQRARLRERLAALDVAERDLEREREEVAALRAEPVPPPQFERWLDVVMPNGKPRREFFENWKRRDAMQARQLPPSRTPQRAASIRRRPFPEIGSPSKSDDYGLEF